ncbi:uncharacterized protein METZ01_LOCUS260236, partial [marine metagenome]
VQTSLWKCCIRKLRADLSEQQFNTWIRPLQVVEEDRLLRLLAPNRFVVDWVHDNCMDQLTKVVDAEKDWPEASIVVEVGRQTLLDGEQPKPTPGSIRTNTRWLGGRLNAAYTFQTFVEGKSNQLARAAASQVAQNPGSAYNPLFISGGVGLGKTHLTHSIGNLILDRQPNAQVAYVHSERFVGDMVKALQHNTINDFKRTYRSLDALLIDDIQFFAGKQQSQEEFFHTFNALLEGQRQIVLTCDRYPKEVSGL